MPNVSSFGAQTDNAVVQGTVTDRDMVIPDIPPSGLMSVGPRVTPNFVKPREWSAETTYHFFDAVRDNAGNAYVAIKPVVPAGTPLTNEDYWFLWADPDTRFNELYETVKTFDRRITQNANDIATKAPINHASEETVYGVGNEVNYGHVRLATDDTPLTSGANNGIAATPTYVLQQMNRNATIIPYSPYISYMHDDLIGFSSQSAVCIGNYIYVGFTSYDTNHQIIAKLNRTTEEVSLTKLSLPNAHLNSMCEYKTQLAVNLDDTHINIYNPATFSVVQTLESPIACASYEFFNGVWYGFALSNGIAKIYTFDETMTNVVNTYTVDYANPLGYLVQTLKMIDDSTCFIGTTNTFAKVKFKENTVCEYYTQENGIEFEQLIDVDGNLAMLYNIIAGVAIGWFSEPVTSSISLSPQFQYEPIGIYDKPNVFRNQNLAYLLSVLHNATMIINTDTHISLRFNSQSKNVTIQANQGLPVLTFENLYMGDVTINNCIFAGMRDFNRYGYTVGHTCVCNNLNLTGTAKLDFTDCVHLVECIFNIAGDPNEIKLPNIADRTIVHTSNFLDLNIGTFSNNKTTPTIFMGNETYKNLNNMNVVIQKDSTLIDIELYPSSAHPFARRGIGFLAIGDPIYVQAITDSNGEITATATTGWTPVKLII